jgi:hypothetical protein
MTTRFSGFTRAELVERIEVLTEGLQLCHDLLRDLGAPASTLNKLTTVINSALDEGDTNGYGKTIQ